MTGSPYCRSVIFTQCSICERGRLSVPALVELRPGRLVCSYCVSDAAWLLNEHYAVAPRVPTQETRP
jgi:hypothetical protein